MTAQLPTVQNAALLRGAATGAADSLDAVQLGLRFGISYRAARAWMRDLPHIQVGRERRTTEVWLAQWMAANVKNAPRAQNFDPLDAAVVEKAAFVVGELVRRGQIAVLPGSFGGTPTGAPETGALPGAGETPALPSALPHPEIANRKSKIANPPVKEAA